MAIYDTIQYIKADVVTVCVGLAASMAAILLSAGTKGKRYSLPFSRIMINKPCWGGNVVDVDIDISKKEVMYIQRIIAEILALHTSQPIEKVYENTEQDYFMSAMEAKEYRIIDRVVSKTPKTINNGD
jgi:Protease subunit of ATP-dependent Clp proteases